MTEPMQKITSAGRQSNIVKEHFVALDYIRGVAALAVCLFHLTLGDILNHEDPIRRAFSFGRLGVEVFFVVSGFVIAYAMFVGRYSLARLPTFLTRRLFRLYPPYLAAVLLSATATWLASLSPIHKTGQFPLTTTQMLSHLVYLNSLLGFPWINGVFWTLAIEFQYYLLMSLVFPFLNSNSNLVRMVSLFSLGLCGVLASGREEIVFQWLPIFGIGIASAMVITGRLSGTAFTIAYLGFVATACFVNGTLEAIAAALTSLTIYWWRAKEPAIFFLPLKHLGIMSYSLYLVHMPIGRRAINYLERVVHSQSERYLAILLAMVVTLLFAQAFWLCIELPIQRQLQKKSRT